MDHSEAVRSQTAEKYLLGELRDRARDDFETHFFECETCAEAVRAGVLFMDNAVAEVQSASARVTAPTRLKEKSSWRDWFNFGWSNRAWGQPAFALSALALVAVSALWMTDHSRLRHELDAADAPQAFSSFPLDVSRGSKPAVVSRHDRFFAASFFINPDTLPEYAVEISGNGVPPANVQIAHNAKGSYGILLPSNRYGPGRYQVTVKTKAGPDGPIIQQFPLYLE